MFDSIKEEKRSLALIDKLKNLGIWDEIIITPDDYGGSNIYFYLVNSHFYYSLYLTKIDNSVMNYGWSNEQYPYYNNFFIPFNIVFESCSDLIKQRLLYHLDLLNV